MSGHAPQSSADAVPTPGVKKSQHKLRISHTKSRGGCYTCKNRHVKCDEVRPVCGACTVRLDECVFPAPVTTRGSSRKRPAPRSHASSLQDLNICVLGLNATFNSTADPGGSQGGLNMHDLQLLQHYILHTSRRMTLHPEKALVWERVITDIASEAEYLMHLLLALAGLDALKMSSNTFSQTRESSIRIILWHHQQGLEGFQKELQSIGDSCLENLMTGTMLINAFAFASLRMGELNPSMDEHSHLPEKPQSQWLNLIRGAFTIVSQSWMQIQRTRLRSLMIFNKANEYWEYFRSDLNVPIELPTGSLSGRLCAFASNASHAILALREYSRVLDSTLAQTSDNNTPEYLQTPGSDTSATASTGGILRSQNKTIEVVETMYMRILHVLCLRRTQVQDSAELEVQAEIEDAAIASWPTLVGEEFISSLDSHDVHGPAQGLSFTILAHLYLTLALLDKIWYFQGTFDLEIKKIAAFVNQSGNVELIELMKWPVHVIGQ